MRPWVVVVEDEPLTRQAIAQGLRGEGFNVAEAADAQACLTLLSGNTPDVVVIDIGLPGLDGLSLAQHLHRRPQLGLVVVSRRPEPETRIRALDLGVDDYMVKPIHHGELAARIRSVIRRKNGRGSERLAIGGWTFDFARRTVSQGETTADLTPGEFAILTLLVQADGAVVDRESLLSAISRRPHDADLRSVDALVSRLRRKLDDGQEPGLITTHAGLGYRLTEPPRPL